MSGGLYIGGDTSGSVLLVPNAVAGSTTITIAPQSGTLNVAGPSFSAYPSASYFAVANSTNTKVPYNTEDWDTASCFDTSLYRFTPNVAGYYQVNAALFINPPAGATSGYILLLYKNGGEYKLLDRDQFEIYFNQLASGSAIVYLNGTTDYIEIYIWQNSGGSLNFGYNGSEIGRAHV